MNGGLERRRLVKGSYLVLRMGNAFDGGARSPSLSRPRPRPGAVEGANASSSFPRWFVDCSNKWTDTCSTIIAKV